MTAPGRRLLPFVAVGAVGFAVQVATLHLLVAHAGVHYLLATALAVQAAILQNFLWHSCWTWRDRPVASPAAAWRRFARFNLLSALSSVTGNVVLTGVLVEGAGAPVVAANAVAVAIVSAINYAGFDRWVFAAVVPRRLPIAALLTLLSLMLPTTAFAEQLTAGTRRAWQRYVAATEARIERELHTTGRFLSSDFDADADRRQDQAALREGVVTVSNMKGEKGAGVSVPSGTIHHWRGAVFIPGATVEQVLSAVADPTGARAHRQEDVLEARVLSRSPQALRLFLKLQRRVIVSAVYNTEHDVTYRLYGADRASSRSVATRIAEVVNLGDPDEHERPPGLDRGFLWGLNSYWRYQAVPGGVIVELESLTLSRAVPWGLGAVIGPLVDQVARESVTRTLSSVRARFTSSTLPL